MKYTQRLDDARLAEVLNERGMADMDGIREMLQAAHDGGTPFCEAVVSANLVSDWDLSRVVAELFQLPFLPVDICHPDLSLWEEMDSPLLRESALVPIRRFGQVLTVAMPGLVGADVLGMLAAETDYFLLPVVGTVESNRRWIEEHSTAPSNGCPAGGWGSVFDEGEAAVQASLDDPVAEADPDSELELSSLEFVGDDDGLEGAIEPPSLVDNGSEDSLDDAESSAIVDLPPMPDFD